MGLFSNKPDHPMADLKSAQKLLQDVPRNDALKALQEITDWIESVRDNAHFHVDQLLDVLSLLDEAARPHMRKLMHEYFSAQAQSKFQENRTWMVLNAFFTQNELTYFKVLTAYRNGDKGSSAVKSSLALIAARGIYAAMGRLKITAARYEQVDVAVWEHMLEFYSHAEVHQYLNQPVKLYATQTQETSVRNIFASVLMWYASGSTTLRPLHMHLAERLAAHFCRRFMVDAQITSNSLICFNLALPGLPLRVTADTKPHPGMRFIGVGDVRPQLEALLKQLEKNIVPQDINFGGVYDADVLKVATRHLLSYWGAPPPMRRQARRQVKLNMSVALGFDRILEQGAIDPGFDYQFASTNDSGFISTWEVEDISATGFRCVLPAKNAEGVRIGSLVGIKPENVGHNGVGIVRRLSRDGQNILHVGVEILSKQVEKILLRAHGSSMSGGEQTAIWVRKPGDEVGEVFLLMNPHAFSMSRSLNTQFEGKGCLLIPLALQERGGDYDLARYRKVEEDSNAEVDETY